VVTPRGKTDGELKFEIAERKWSLNWKSSSKIVAWANLFEWLKKK
jgi:hypothetical protein